MVYLVRQCQSDWNLHKKFNGCTETELNQTGINQAKFQAENLEDVDFDVCYCSPQKRTHQTCEILYKGTVVHDIRLVEIDCGEFEGTEETVDAMKSFWKAIQIGDKGTESLENFTKRNCDFCDMIMKDHKGRNVLIVTHSLNTRIVNYYFNGKPENYDFFKSVGKIGELLTFEN